MKTMTTRPARHHVPNLIELLSGTAVPTLWSASDTFIPVEENVSDGIYTLRADLPGVDPDKDVSVTISEGVLTIKGERRSETRGEGRSEVRYGTFARSLALPGTADASAISASYADGVLTVTLPLGEEELKPTKVPITRAEEKSAS